MDQLTDAGLRQHHHRTLRWCWQQWRARLITWQNQRLRTAATRRVAPEGAAGESDELVEISETPMTLVRTLQEQQAHAARLERLLEDAIEARREVERRWEDSERSRRLAEEAAKAQDDLVVALRASVSSYKAEARTWRTILDGVKAIHPGTVRRLEHHVQEHVDEWHEEEGRL